MIRITFTDGHVIEYPTAINNCPSIGDNKFMHLIEKMGDTLEDIAVIPTSDIEKLEIFG